MSSANSDRFEGKKCCKYRKCRLLILTDLKKKNYAVNIAILEITQITLPTLTCDPITMVAIGTQTLVGSRCVDAVSIHRVTNGQVRSTFVDI